MVLGVYRQRPEITDWAVLIMDHGFGAVLLDIEPYMFKLCENIYIFCYIVNICTRNVYNCYENNRTLPCPVWQIGNDLIFCYAF